MKKVAIIALACLFVLGSFQAGYSETMSVGSTIDQAKILSKLVENISSQFTTVEARNTGNTRLGGNSTDGETCLEIDIEVTETVVSNDPFAPSFAEGYFELVNCGDEAAEILLDIEVGIDIGGVVDTLISFPGIPIVLGAGEVISEEFRFPVPPFDAVYTFCVTATSGETVVSDCDSIQVEGTEFPGIPFHSPGILVQGTECVLFAPLGAQDELLVLDNYGEFEVGDEVWVAGMLVWECETDCPDASGCVIENEIHSGGPPDIPFEACGILVQGTDCVLFAPGGDEYALFVLEHYGDFRVGDTVFVRGHLEMGCASECSDAVGCIAQNTIDPCGGEEPGFPFEACGLLVQGTDCVLFAPAGDEVLFVLQNYGDFQVGDTVFVAGLMLIQCETECQEAEGCIIDNLIDTCFGGGPGIPIEACGILVQGTSCKLFVPFGYGPFGFDSVRFVLDNYGGFQVGDTVRVFGILDFDCQTECPDATGCITENRIDRCDNGPPPGHPVEACGVLVQATNCVLFDPFEYGPSWFGPELLELENYSEFQVGDTVFVFGLLVPECGQDCPDAAGCIIGNIIDTCYGGGPTHPFESCGTLVQGTECVLFEPFFFDSAWFPTGKFVLDDYGNFQVGDTVFVFGHMVPDCEAECPDAIGCIVENIIDTCYGGGPGIPFDGCGTLVQGTDCLLFDPFNDGGPGNDLTGLVLDEYGEFTVDDTVFVLGFLVPNCETDCSDAVGCIYENIIEQCGGPPGWDTIRACGVLVQGTECVLFALEGGGPLFSLDEYGNFQVGDTVFVDGVVVPDCGTACPDAVACIIGNVIDSCRNGQPGIPFQAPGTLVQGVECLMFAPLGNPFQKLVLDNYGDFQAGDTVVVSGTLIIGCETICMEGFGCVVDNTIEAWGMPGTQTVVSLQNFPNPFNPTTTISFELSSVSHVNLTVYNVVGQTVITLIDETMGAGTHSVEWDGKSTTGGRLSSGVYFYRLETGGAVETRKMLMLK